MAGSTYLPHQELSMLHGDMAMPLRSRRARNDQALRLSAAYTFNDFTFDDGAVYGDNQLAGVQRHVLIAEARFDRLHKFDLSTTLRWIPDGPWADYTNTERAPGYETVQITAGVTLTDGIELFGSVENLFDEVFVSNVATNANQRLTNKAIFTPGQGRAFFGGLRARF